MSIEIFPIDIGVYDNHADLDVAAEVTKVAASLAGFDGTVLRPWKVSAEERGGDAVRARLKGWPTNDAGPTLLYWIGHGWSDNRTAALADARSSSVIGDDGITPDVIAKAIRNWESKADSESWLLVVIDACKSAVFTERLAEDLDHLGGRRRVVILGTSAKASTTIGRFTDELQLAVSHAFADDPEISVVALANEVCRKLNGRRRILEIYDDAALTRTTPIATGFQGPLDVRRELDQFLRDLPEDERRHFVTKAHGGELGGTGVLGELTWHFTGRERERSEILESLERGGLTVVTGRAGSGKSAILGDILVRSRPELAGFLLERGLLGPANHSDPPPFDAAIHLSGLPSDQVLARLYTDLALEEPDPTAPFESRADALEEMLATDEKPRRILLDALDESVEPFRIAGLIRRIARRPSATVLVGTRRSTEDGPDQPETTGAALLDALGPSSSIPVKRDRDATFDYVRERLEAIDSNGTQRAEIAQIARAIANVDQEFLYARLATHELLRRPTLITEADPVASIGGTHRAVFAAAVDRLAQQEPAFGPLLAALGVSQGRGLPVRDGVWATIATAIAGETINEEPIDRLIDAASPYLVLNREHDQTVYRLAHRTFVEHYTSDVDCSRSWHKTIVRSAIEAQETEPNGNPYWLHYTSAHCVLAGVEAWQEVAQSKALNSLDPSSVAADAGRASFGVGQKPIAVASIEASAHLLPTTPNSDRWGVRCLTAARLGGQLDDNLRPDSAAWFIGWSSVRAQTLHRILAGHDKSVDSLAFGTTMEGRLLLASGSADGTVRVSDPMTGASVGKPLTGRASSVSTVAFGTTRDGRLLLASSSLGQTVQVWDPVKGSLVRDLVTDDGDFVTSLVAFGRTPDGQLLLAAGCAAGHVHIWDPVTGDRVGMPLTSDVDQVGAVAFGPTREGLLLLAIVGSSNGIVEVWDAIERAPLAEPFTGHAGGIQSVALWTTAEGQLLLATAGWRDEVRIWDPTTGTKVDDLLTGHVQEASSVTFGVTAEGQLLLASGSLNGSVRVWDPVAGAQIGGPLTGNSSRVNSVALSTTRDGRLHLASGGRDGTVRVWAPRAEATREPLLRHTESCCSVQFGTTPAGQVLLAAGGGWNETVRIFDSATGAQVGNPLTGHTDGTLQVAFGSTHEGRLLLATAASKDETVRIWDPVTADALGELPTGHVGGVPYMALGTARNGRLLLASSSWVGPVRLWDPVTGVLRGELNTHKASQVVFGTTRNGQLLLATGGSWHGPVKVWDPLSMVLKQELPAESVHELAFGTTDEGQLLLAIGEKESVQIWDPVKGVPFGEPLVGHTGSPRSIWLGATRMGRLLLAAAVGGGWDGKVRIWDLFNGQTIREIPVGSNVNAIAGIDSGLLAVGMGDGLMVINPLNSFTEPV